MAAVATPVATGGTFTYDGTAHDGACAVTGVNGESLAGTISYSSGGAPVNAGSYTVTCSFAGDANYAAASDEAAITVDPAAASVTADSYTRSYLAPDPTFGGTVSGFVAADGITATYSSPGAGSQVPGVYPTVPTLVDPNGRLGNYAVTSTNGTLTITNTAPVCTTATAQPASIWPPNHKLVPITISGYTDLDGGPLAIVIDSIFQDEPTNTASDGNTAIDGSGIGTDTAWVRAERMGKSWKGPKSGKGSSKSKKSGKNGKSDKGGGNGRVYHITFTVTDSLGLTCTGTVTVGVPHDQSGLAPVDDGPVYDSTVAAPVGKPGKSDKSDKSDKSAKSDKKSDKNSGKSDKKSDKSNGKSDSKSDKAPSKAKSTKSNAKGKKK
jgi:hypothetical protein